MLVPNDAVMSGGKCAQLLAVFFALLGDFHDARRRIAVCSTTCLAVQRVAAAADSIAMV